MYYWEKEEPIEFDTGKNILRYFAKAGKMQISGPYWTNNAGEQKPGKTVTLDLAALNTEARELIRRAIHE